MTRLRTASVLALTAAGAIAGYGASLLSPTLYASTSTLLVIPAVVSESVVPGQVQPIDTARMQTLRQQLTSRTRLEQLIDDFSLYDEEAKALEEDDLFRMMRDRVLIELDGDAVHVGFVDANPGLAKRVTERLASMMVDENMRHREIRAENTKQFLDSQMAEMRRRLDEKHAQLVERRREGRVPRSIELDVEVLEARYRGLSTMSEEAKVAANLERRQIGEQFRVIDAARLPEHPMARGVHKLSLLGGGLGLLAGLGIAFRRPRG
jgi:uncharacterized protein involved in exopolysaccharide biosynthesis